MRGGVRTFSIDKKRFKMSSWVEWAKFQLTTAINLFSIARK